MPGPAPRLAEAPAEAGCRPTEVRRWRSGRVLAAQDRVAEERPVALEYNGISHAVMLATPGDLEDFAIGFSLTEGLVDQVSQVLDIEVAHGPEGSTLRLQVTAACFARFKDRRRSLAGRTGCGLCGAESLSQVVRPLPTLPPQPGAYRPDRICEGLAQLRGQQALLEATGATHAAGWCDASGRLHLVREDVGRHNALDKLIGALLRARGLGADQARQGFVVVTSRASHEMVQKTAAAGVPLLAAVSGVTALAIDTAEAAGLCLLGFARGPDFSIYTHGQRLALEAHP
ncbi:MAG: formate dehydrogenase accessory sulfurtransferase FdhD [Curvibacter sp.]|nr:formate dehydrogenase accessory sulfurtransferase FdhD [Curvibacter sp.]